MLWDIIRDFFVQYIFGGYLSNGDFYYGMIGHANIYNVNGSWVDSIDVDTLVYTTNIGVVDGYSSNDSAFISLGDWLSTTFTIITLCLICFFFLKLTIYLFKMGANLFKW